MTQVSHNHEQVRIRFPGWEALMTRRRSVTIRRRAIRSARAEAGWSSEVLGLRSGLVISGRRKVGTFRHPSGTHRLVSMTRDLPLLRLGVDRAATGFDEILLSTPEAARIAEALRAGALA